MKTRFTDAEPCDYITLIVDYLFLKRSSYTYFALHKLIYLIAYKVSEHYPEKITTFRITNRKDGPYCPYLELPNLQSRLPYLHTRQLSRTNILVYKESVVHYNLRLIDQFQIKNSVKLVIDQVIIDHGSKSNAALRRATYFTRPMRNIIGQTMLKREDLYKICIQFH